MGAQGLRRNRDLWVIGAVVVIVAGGAAAAYFALSTRSGRDLGQVIARLEQLVNNVEARRPETLRWDMAAKGMALVDRHTLRTGALSGARVVFNSGRRFAVGEGTTITLREARGDNPQIALEVGVVRPEIPGGQGGLVSARVALPGGKVLTLTARKAGEAGGAHDAADEPKALAKIVVEENKSVVIQANDDLVAKIDEAPMGPGLGAGAPREGQTSVSGTSGFDLKQGAAVEVKRDGAKEEIAVPARPEISDIQLVGVGNARELVVLLRNTQPGINYQAEIARDAAFKEGRRFLSASQKEFRFQVSEPGRWFVRVVARGRGQVESGPSFPKSAVVPALPKPSIEEPETVADAGAEAVADAGAEAVADAGADAGAGQAVPPTPVVKERDEPVCARVGGGGSITKQSGASRSGRCAVPGDSITATSAAVNVSAPGVGDVRVFAGGRVRVVKISEEAFALSVDHGVAEVRAREHLVEVKGAVGIRVQPHSTVRTSLRPGEFDYVEGVLGRASVNLGSGYKDLRAGEAYHRSPITNVRKLHPYRQAGVAVRTTSRSEYLAPSEKTTLRAEWKASSQPVDVTVKFGGKTILQTPIRKGSFSYETHAYGTYTIVATTKSGETLFDAAVTLKRDPWKKVEPVTKTLPVRGIREGFVDYDTLLPNLRFTWELIPGAKKYYFSLATDSGFKKRVLDEEVADTEFTVPSSRFKERTKVYYWRAVAGGGAVDDTRGPFKLTFRFKSNAPSLWIHSPKSHTKIHGGTFLTSGDAVPKSTLKINQVNVDVHDSGRWSATLALKKGENWVTYEATDPGGRVQKFLRRVEVE